MHDQNCGKMCFLAHIIYKEKENFTAAIGGISLTNEMQYTLLPKKKNLFIVYMLSLSFNIFISLVNALPISV